MQPLIPYLDGPDAIKPGIAGREQMRVSCFEEIEPDIIEVLS